MKKQIFFVKSKIARRISKKMSIIYISIYFFILVTLLLILSPSLYRIAVDKAAYNLSVMTDEFRILQDSMAESLNSLNLDLNLDLYLSSYYSDPSISNKEKVNLCLNKIVSINSNTLSFCLEDRNGGFFSSLSHSYLNKQEYLHSYPSYMELLNYNYSSYFSPIIRNQFRSAYLTYECFAYSKNLNIADHPLTATVFYNATTMMKHCSELSDTTFTSFSIINRYNSFLYLTAQKDLYKNFPEKLNKSKTTTGKLHGERGIFFYQSIPSTNCTLIAYTPYSQLLSTPAFIVGVIMLLYLLSPILYMLFLAPLIQRQLAPLKKLSDAMSGYTVGKDIHTDIHTEDEIEVVNNSFHKMIKEINRQIDKIKKKEHENSVISYKLLATQIDPHFIYNTMNIINIMAQEGNMEAVVEINSALIRILRERLNAKLNVFESIKNEVDTMMQYCLIASYRYKNHISVCFNIDEALENKLIPKNILQPLVENAFFHGFPDERSIADGSVGILIYSMENEIIIEVSDNGQGMSQARINELLNSSYSIYKDKKPHIGIDNIKQRLNYLYNGNYQLVIQSAESQGTTVIITVPDISASQNS